jgi:curved DNA-binding protein CbpA
MPQKVDDYYALLGVPRNADVPEIKKAYRKKAMQYHPDKNPDDPKAQEMFKACAEAYEVLTDPQKRQVYDQFGAEGLKGGGGMPPGGMPGFTHFSSSGVDPFNIFNQVFAEFGGFEGGGGGGPQFMFHSSGFPGGGGFSSGGGFPGGGHFDPFMQGGGFSPFASQTRSGKRPRRHSKHSQTQQFVTISGLFQSPELNGKLGTLLRYNHDRQRYDVQIHNRTVSLKPENVILSPKTLVQVHGLQTSPQYNDSWAEVLGFNQETGKYDVQIIDGQQLRLKPTNIRAEV